MNEEERDALARRILRKIPGLDVDALSPDEVQELLREAILSIARNEDSQKEGADFILHCIDAGLLEPEMQQGPLVIGDEDVATPLKFDLKELEDRPDVTLRDEGKYVVCSRCNMPHPLVFGGDGGTINGADEEFTPSAFMGFVECGNLGEDGELVMVVVGNKLLPGVEFTDEA